MDELGSKLSQLSFAIIGVICVIGVLQSKSWLDMFTIGGQWHASDPNNNASSDPYIRAFSLACGGCNPGGPSYRHNGHTRSWCPAHGATKCYCQEAPFSRSFRMRERYLLRQNWSVLHVHQRLVIVMLSKLTHCSRHFDKERANGH